ncbi:MAG TPA: FAD-dependent oxidoreductase [Armatimonadota bacterium]|jgi:NAD(P)H-nitrite reductase large subunit
MEQEYDYIIVGAGRAGGSAVEGIRKKNEEKSILLIGKEEYLPYDRPDLSKKLWSGKKTVEQIFPYDRDFYMDNNVDLLLDTEVTALDANNKRVKDSRRNTWGFDRLLLATGGTPRKLDIPGGDLEGILYYRNLDDYKALRDQIGETKSALVIGGGFIGSELAASVCASGIETMMLLREPWLVHRVFPEGLALAIEQSFADKGIQIEKGDAPEKIEKTSGRFLTTTLAGRQIESDIILVGIGITPSIKLAEAAKLKVNNGIIVDENLRTSHEDIYAAGDNAEFPYTALGQRMRVEHWDNAVKQGFQAGMNMAGGKGRYDHMPYFWSDLFEFGYEAVGELNSEMDIFADWETENEKGVIYYLRDKKLRGVMTCNIYGKMDEARQLIRSKKDVSPDDLKGAIK